jgi:hypothetical protein
LFHRHGLSQDEKFLGADDGCPMLSNNSTRAAAVAHVAGDQAERAYRRGDTLGSWGGRRKGAGRKRDLTFSDRREIASEYFVRRQKGSDLGNTPRREAVARGHTNVGLQLRRLQQGNATGEIGLDGYFARQQFRAAHVSCGSDSVL